MSLRVDGPPPSDTSFYPAKPREEESCWSRVEQAYERAIKNLIAWLEECAGHAVAMAIGTLLLEFCHALRAAIEWLFLSCCGTPHFSNVNPEILTPAQLKMNPVLCLHGNYHSPSAFTGIAGALKSAHNPAVFTVQLNSGNITQEDNRLIEARIQEIVQLYQRHGVDNVKIDLIGHSRGASLAHRHSDNERIGKVVLIGHYTNPEQLDDQTLQINGLSDCLISDEDVQLAREHALIDPNHCQVVSTGHLGLLYHPTAQASIVHWLKV